MADEKNDLSRRTVVRGAAALGGLVATGALGANLSQGRTPMTQPAIFLPHGGGPWPWMKVGLGGPGAHDALRVWLEDLPHHLERPKAILCVTAHWEEPVVTVSTSAAPGMLYDYYNFPEHTYEVTWPAPGAPDVAARALALLEAAGIPHRADAERGYDHGTFVPLSVAWPEADVPVVQMSLVKGLDPAHHLAVGRALRPLRDEGVLIVGSGMSYHNMRGFFGKGQADAVRFDAWLGEAMKDPAGRAAALEAWSQAPSGRASHPREEHLLPLMVVAGAGEGDVASLPFRDDVIAARVSAVRFDVA